MFASQLLQQPARHLMHVGLGPEFGRSALGIVLSARLTWDGSHILVLDAVPPFVKVFDRSGRLSAAFVGKGGGPLEARLPTALAVSGDSLLMIADVSGRLSEFDIKGQLHRQSVFAGIRALVAAEACGAEWAVYAPILHGGARAVTWLHRVRLDDAGSGTTTDLFSDSSVPGPDAGFGRPYGLIRSGDRIVLRHDLGNRASLVEWRCGDRIARALTIPDAAGRPGLLPATQSQLRRVLVGGTTATPAGVAFLRRGLLLANVIVSSSRGGEPVSYTQFDHFEDGSVRRTTVTGRYFLLDSKAGLGTLVGTSDPVPQVFLLAERDLIAALAVRGN